MEDVKYNSSEKVKPKDPESETNDSHSPEAEAGMPDIRKTDSTHVIAPNANANDDIEMKDVRDKGLEKDKVEQAEPESKDSRFPGAEATMPDAGKTDDAGIAGPNASVDAEIPMSDSSSSQSSSSSPPSLPLL